MLTPDRYIDRRILLGADSLEAVGWDVIIIAMPLDGPGTDDRRVVRLAVAPGQSQRENLVLLTYRWIRAHLPMNGSLMRWLKRLAWKYLVDQESFYVNLFYPIAARYSPAVFVAHDLPVLPVAKILADKCGARIVYDSHELYSEQEFSGREKCRWAEIESKYIKSCDAIIAVNQSVANELQTRYGSMMYVSFTTLSECRRGLAHYVNSTKSSSWRTKRKFYCYRVVYLRGEIWKFS